MEVINVKEAREYVQANYPNDPLLKHIVIAALEQLPAVDAEDVVRCRECVKREVSQFDEAAFCVPCGFKCSDPEWYCPEGERKGGNDCPKNDGK